MAVRITSSTRSGWDIDADRLAWVPIPMTGRKDASSGFWIVCPSAIPPQTTRTGAATRREQLRRYDIDAGATVMHDHAVSDAVTIEVDVELRDIGEKLHRSTTR
jgi:hypothetical protein